MLVVSVLDDRGKFDLPNGSTPFVAASIVQFTSKITVTESWKSSANSASLHLCAKNSNKSNMQRMLR